MSRNIVLCCDGTANQFNTDRTSVLKLCFALTKDSERQLVYYHPGIGTRAPMGVGTAIGGAAAKLAGLVFGYGLKADIADAYVFLMNNVQPGDRVFLFGFSRGAYTARLVAAMLKLYGLSMPGNEALVPYAVDMMWSISRAKNSRQVAEYFKLAEEYADTLSAQKCKTHFLGVWDTVNSVGWIGSPLAIPFARHNPDVNITRHAIAIDERRAFYRVNWFEEAEGADIQQVWFPGVHCDVGGGYPEAESAISKYPLEWMINEAVKAGLLVDADRVAQILGRHGDRFTAAAPAQMHESLKGAWHLAEFIPKARYDRARQRQSLRMNLYRRRTMPDDACVHDVAWVMDAYADRLPAGAVRLSEKGGGAGVGSVSNAA